MTKKLTIALIAISLFTSLTTLPIKGHSHCNPDLVDADGNPAPFHLRYPCYSNSLNPFAVSPSFGPEEFSEADPTYETPAAREKRLNEGVWSFPYPFNPLEGKVRNKLSSPKWLQELKERREAK